MFRTFAAVAVVALVGFSVFRVVLGMVGGVFGMLLGLAFLVFKLLLLAGVIYFILSIFAPDTARKVRTAVGVEDPPPQA